MAGNAPEERATGSGEGAGTGPVEQQPSAAARRPKRGGTRRKCPLWFARQRCHRAKHGPFACTVLRARWQPHQRWRHVRPTAAVAPTTTCLPTRTGLGRATEDASTQARACRCASKLARSCSPRACVLLTRACTRRRHGLDCAYRRSATLCARCLTRARGTPARRACPPPASLTHQKRVAWRHTSAASVAASTELPRPLTTLSRLQMSSTAIVLMMTIPGACLTPRHRTARQYRRGRGGVARG